jgi:hypothetical protein
MFLFDLADAIDIICLPFLRIRSELLWRYNQIRSRFVKNEFDHSLDMDLNTLLYLNKVETTKYIDDLIRKRMTTHEKDLI